MATETLLPVSSIFFYSYAKTYINLLAIHFIKVTKGTYSGSR